MTDQHPLPEHHSNTLPLPIEYGDQPLISADALSINVAAKACITSSSPSLLQIWQPPSGLFVAPPYVQPPHRVESTF